MNPHLTAEQFSTRLAGESLDRETELHLQNCPKCQAEMSTAEGALTIFRSSVREWSDKQYNPQHFLAASRASSKTWLANLYWAAAVTVLILSFGLYHFGPVTNTKPPNPSDAALFSQLDSQTSRTLPEAMEPLTQLVSWEANPTQYNDADSHRGSKR